MIVKKLYLVKTSLLSRPEFLVEAKSHIDASIKANKIVEEAPPGRVLYLSEFSTFLVEPSPIRESK